MKRLQEPETAVDTFGLHDDFISEIRTEIIGSNVRLIIGVYRCGEVHWVRSTVCAADRLVVLAKDIATAAQEALDLQYMMGQRRGH